MHRHSHLTVTALAAGETAGGDQVLFAAGAFGVAVSGDLGMTWQRPFAEGELPAVTDIAVSQDFAHNGRIYLGTADGCLVCDLPSWSCRRVLTDGCVLSLTVVPTVGTQPPEHATKLDQVFVGTDTDGLFASNDGSEQWEACNAGLLDLSILAFAASPAFASDRTAFLGTATGIQRSRNGGRAWRALDLAVGEDVAVQCIALSPGFVRDQQLFAGSEESGLYVSQDAGDTWKHVSALDAPTINAIAISPKSGAVAVGTERGAYLSDNAGVTWHQSPDEVGAVLTLCWLEVEDVEWLCAGLFQQGVARSRDNGLTWKVVDPTGCP